MSVLSVALVVALATVLIAEFINGWTDAPNVIATVVSTGVMTPRAAIVMAVVLNTVGAMAGHSGRRHRGQGHRRAVGHDASGHNMPRCSASLPGAALRRDSAFR